MNDSKLCSTISKKLALCALLSLPYTNTVHAQQNSNEVADRVLGQKDKDLSRVEAAIKQQKELEADALKLTAEKAYSAGDLSSAVEGFSSAIRAYKKVSASEARVLDKIKDSSKKLSVIYKKFAVELIAEANKNLSVEQFDEAMETLDRALKFNPDLDQFVAEQKRIVLDLRKEAERVAAINAKELTVQYERLNANKKWRFEQSQLLFTNRRYVDARDMLEEILVLDPFDSKAATLLLRVNKKLFESGRSRRIATVQERVDEVAWKWSLPIKSASVGLTSELNDGGKIPVTSDFVKITEKLKIIIPRFRQNAKIEEILDALKEESILQDVDKKGISIIYRPYVGGGDAPVAAADEGEFDAFEAAEDDPFADPEEAAPVAAAEVVSVDGKKFNFDFENMPIGEVIRYICIAAGLKYKVDDHAVVIADPRVQIDEMVIRFYPVNSQVFAALKTSGSGDGGSDLVGGIGDVEDEDGGDVKSYLGAMGVQFPAGANVAYLAGVSRLVVTNTVTEQRRIQEIINQLQVDAAQIIIETKFVEINQGDLEEFGFQWTLQEAGAVNDHFNLVPNMANTQVTVGGVATNAFNNGNVGNTGFGVDGLTSVGGLSSGIRDVGDFTDNLVMNGLDLIDGAAGSGFLSFTSVLGANQFNTVVRALSQQTNADILSAPKVITQNGNTAILRVVQERYFPESWEPPELLSESNTAAGTNVISNITVTPSLPVFGDPTDLGVVLEVTPQVDPDGVTIELELKPQVVEFVGLDSTFNSTILQSDDDGVTVNIVPTRFDMPILSSRTVDTRIKMWDGESVVIGGLLKEKVISWSDKVPYLSAIPLIGELFKNEGDGRVKQNLLIFVSARLVNNAGLPIRENNIRGLPDFKRL